VLAEKSLDIVRQSYDNALANKELLENVTSPSLRCMGSDLYEIWEKIVVPERFRYIHVEDLIPIVIKHCPDQSWAEYMDVRYGKIS